jgi:hypothetical protein
MQGAYTGLEVFPQHPWFQLIDARFMISNHRWSKKNRIHYRRWSVIGQNTQYYPFHVYIVSQSSSHIFPFLFSWSLLRLIEGSFGYAIESNPTQNIQILIFFPTQFDWQLLTMTRMPPKLIQTLPTLSLFSGL